MDRNNIIGIVLIFGMISLFTWWNKPSAEEQEQLQRYKDSVAIVQHYNDSALLASQILANQEQPKPSAVAENKTVDNTLDQQKSAYGIFGSSASGQESFYTLENERIKLVISTKGGKPYSVQLKEYQTWDSLPLILFEGDENQLGFSFFSQNRLINTNDFFFEPIWKESSFNKTELSVNGDQEVSFSMRLYADKDDAAINSSKYIEYRYTLKGKSYEVDFDINFVGMQDVIASRGNFIDLQWTMDVLQQEKLRENRLNGLNTYYKYYQDEVSHLKDNSDDEESISTRLRWVSYKQQFFSTVLIADKFFDNADLKTETVALKEQNSDRYLKTMNSLIGLPYDPQNDQTIALSFYYGPNKYKVYKKMDLGLERQIQLGWGFFVLSWINRFAIIPVFNFLEGFGWNYGIIILVLTILLKIFLLPVAYRTYTSSAKMRVLKPEVDEINEKFPNKDDAMKKQQAVMALYKKAGASPMSGCLPMLLQMPILIAMFRFFPGAIELRQQSFLWAHDLSTYDSILSLPWNIPFYGDHVSLFTLLMTISTIIYTKINSEMTGQSNQMPGMKTMMYMMPIMFLGFFNSYPAGLSYYYFLANIITFFQMFLFRKLINEEKLHAKIQANKKKSGTPKKSGFQKRMEDMAKRQGVNLPKK